MSYIIDKHLLQIIRESVLKYDFEICGNLRVSKPGDKRLMVVNHSKGDKTPFGVRKSCNYKEYSTFIFHTHPYSSYSYPSFEDINKVSKHPKIKTSVLATLWGIWQISRLPENKERKEIDKKEISDILYSIGSKTVNKSFKERKSSVKSLELETHDIVMKTIIDYLPDLNKILEKYGLVIRFHSWLDIELLEGSILTIG